MILCPTLASPGLCKQEQLSLLFPASHRYSEAATIEFEEKLYCKYNWYTNTRLLCGALQEEKNQHVLKLFDEIDRTSSLTLGVEHNLGETF